MDISALKRSPARMALTIVLAGFLLAIGWRAGVSVWEWVDNLFDILFDRGAYN